MNNHRLNVVTIRNTTQHVHPHVLAYRRTRSMLCALFLSVMALPAMHPLAPKQESPILHIVAPQHEAQPVEKFAQFPLETPKALEASLSPAAANTSTILRGALSYGTVSQRQHFC